MYCIASLSTKGVEKSITSMYIKSNNKWNHKKYLSLRPNYINYMY